MKKINKQLEKRINLINALMKEASKTHYILPEYDQGMPYTIDLNKPIKYEGTYNGNVEINQKYREFPDGFCISYEVTRPEILKRLRKDLTLINRALKKITK